MLTTRQRTSLIEQIRSLPAALRSSVEGLTDKQLDTPYREGGWTPRQVVHHVADSHLNAFVRMKLILTEDHPSLKPYDQDAWAATTDGNQPPVAPSLAIVQGLHERWGMLMVSIPDDAWTRAGRHPERGEVTLEDLLVTYASHGHKHVDQILGLRRARGW